MDPLGSTVRELLRQKRDDSIRAASALAGGLKKEGLTKDEIEEMLYASGFEEDVVKEAMESPSKKGSSERKKAKEVIRGRCLRR